MKTFKAVLMAILFIFLLAKLSAAQNIIRGNIINIETMYAEDVSISLRSKIDSTVLATVSRFNQGLRISEIVVNHPAIEQSATLHITKGKLATKKQRRIAYAVNLVAPLYVPMHKIKSTVNLSQGNLMGSVRPVKSSAHILVGKIEKREARMLKKYSDKLYQELIYIDDQVNRAIIAMGN